MLNKTMPAFLFSFFLLAFFQPSALAAQGAAVSRNSDLGQALAHLSALQGFSCQFKQVLSYAEGGERSYSGELAVLRPGKFRWHYTKPYEQLYVSNGEEIWLYEPDLMQAQRLQDLGEVEPVVLQLLDGRVGLEDITVLAKEDSYGSEGWHLLVGKGSQAVDVYVGVLNQTLSWIGSVDALANRNTLHLLQLRPKKPETEIFEFHAPEGVDVIGALE